MRPSTVMIPLVLTGEVFALVGKADTCLGFNAVCNPRKDKCCSADGLFCAEQGGEQKYHCHHCQTLGKKCDKGQSCCPPMTCNFWDGSGRTCNNNLGQ
ncbi:unnamed protein product [Cercospora beticola]|nr:unnamed protein product [Cercospora beticola]